LAFLSIGILESLGLLKALCGTLLLQNISSYGPLCMIFPEQSVLLWFMPPRVTNHPLATCSIRTNACI